METMRIKIGVMGSAGGAMEQATVDKCRELGRAVVDAGSATVTGGRSGTLGEFAIAYDEGWPVGVLTGTGGVADHSDDFLEIIRKPTGSHIVYDDDPRRLIEWCVAHYQETPPHIRNREASG